ncbi:hypothetical protein [Microbacterium sp.]|jgi:hypothetical protein|uniref:hypothetical protein n=1 Tax=Microbacterium sp. TaxID=51671 RepID=UPI0037C9CBDC
MRLLPASLLLLVVAGVLVGCTSSDASTSASAEPTASASPEPTATVTGADPLDLIGTWRISEADGETPGTVVRIGLGGLEIWRSCGDVVGSWVADHTQMRAVVSGYSQTCDPLPPLTWIDDTASYELTAESATLRSGDGGVLAVLIADDAAESPDRVTLGHFSTEIDDRARDHFAGIVSWPAGLEPAEPGELLGEWVPQGDFAADPHVVFSEAGHWSGTDGCNGGGGRWIVSAGGSFDSTSGASTLVGCDGAPVPSWVMTARGAGMDGDELVLLDISGQELGRLIRT